MLQNGQHQRNNICGLYITLLCKERYKIQQHDTFTHYSWTSGSKLTALMLVLQGAPRKVSRGSGNPFWNCQHKPGQYVAATTNLWAIDIIIMSFSMYIITGYFSSSSWYIMYSTQSTGIWQSVKLNFHQHLGAQSPDSCILDLLPSRNTILGTPLSRMASHD